MMRRIMLMALLVALAGCNVYVVREGDGTLTAVPATPAPVVTNTPAATAVPVATDDPTPTQENLTPSPAPTRRGEIGLPVNANSWLRAPVTHLPFNDSPTRNMDVPAAFLFEWRAGGFAPWGFLKDDPGEAGDTVVRWDFAWISGTWCYGQDGLILHQGQRYLLRMVYNADLARASGDFATSDVRFFASLNNASGGATVETYGQDVAGAVVNGGEVLWVIESDRPAPMLQYRVCMTVNWADFSKAVVEWDEVEVRPVPDGYGDVVVGF